MSPLDAMNSFNLIDVIFLIQPRAYSIFTARSKEFLPDRVSLVGDGNASPARRRGGSNQTSQNEEIE